MTVEKVFTIPANKMAEMDNWLKEHAKNCPHFKARPDFCFTRPYMYTFRESGIGNGSQIVCDCGEKFYSTAGDEYL